MTASNEPDGTCAGLSKGAQEQLHYALLSELASELEHAHEQISTLRDGGLDQWPLVTDARPVFDWIAQTVEALDACGWQESRERLAAEWSAKHPIPPRADLKVQRERRES